MNDEEKVFCRTASPGEQPARIEHRKYDLLRSVILAELSEGGRVVHARLWQG